MARLALLLGAVGALLGAAHVPVMAEESPVPPPLAYRSLSPRLAELKDPLVLHVRLEADGRFGLRRAVPAETPTWAERGPWGLKGTPAEQMEALRMCALALRDAHTTPPTAGVREPTLHSAARLVVDAGPGVPWRHVQWVVAAAADPAVKIYRVSFLPTGDGAWIDVDLPRDWAGPGRPRGAVEKGRLVTVKLFRRGVGEPGPQYTRLRVTARDATFRANDVFEEAIPEEEEPAPEQPVESPPSGEPIDLPPAGGSAEVRATAWQRVEVMLAAVTEDAGRWVAEVKTPPPTGQLVPAGDVLEALAGIAARKPRAIQLEGAPAPTGGWGLLR
jgi:hypothetical protein